MAPHVGEVVFVFGTLGGRLRSADPRAGAGPGGFPDGAQQTGQLSALQFSGRDFVGSAALSDRKRSVTRFAVTPMAVPQSYITVTADLKRRDWARRRDAVSMSKGSRNTLDHGDQRRRTDSPTSIHVST